jgi:5'-3' exonuclease
VYATATEDMDALTFGSPRLVRNLTFSFAGQKQEFAYEYNLQQCLAELKMTMKQFVDLCILLGCDFAPKIKGIGTYYEFAVFLVNLIVILLTADIIVANARVMLVY